MIEDEEVDWVGAVPDSDDEVDSGSEDDPLDGLPTGHGLRSAPADWNLSDNIASLVAKEQARHSPVKSASLLRANGGIDTSRLEASPSRLNTPSPSRPPPRTTPPSSYSIARAKSPLAGDRDISAPVPEAFEDAEGDEGIVLARKPRRGSVLSRAGSRRGTAAP